MQKKKFKPKRSNTAEKMRAQALRRIRQRWEEDHEGEEFDPRSGVVVGDILSSADGGIPAVIESLRSYSDPDARSFIEFYSDLTAYEREHLTIDEIAYASGIGPLRLSELAQSAMIVSGKLKATMLLTSSMHKVLASTVKAATDMVPILDLLGNVVGYTNGDTKAMEMFLKVARMMPIPKGSKTIINMPGANDNEEEEEDENSDTRPAWMDSGQRLREIHDTVDQRRLPAPKSEPIHIGGALDAMQTQTADILKGE